MLIQPYDPEWGAHFQEIKTLLQSSLADCEIRIEHVGSTSVPGLAAKPIIDVDLVYAANTAFAEILKGLEAIGYFHNGDQGIPGREVFKRKATIEPHPLLDGIKHHLYVCAVDSEELQKHILFRNYLREHAWARSAYEVIKYDIAKEVNQDQKAYAALKEERARSFILLILEKAKAV